MCYVLYWMPYCTNSLHASLPQSLCKVARLSHDRAECHALALRNIWREIKGARVVTQV